MKNIIESVSEDAKIAEARVQQVIEEYEKTRK